MARKFTRLDYSGAANPARVKYTLDKLMTDLEAELGAQADAIAALAAAAAAQAAADAAQADATTAISDAATAQSTATTAQTTADTAKKDDKISASWTSPGSVLSATDAGSDATISIAAHTRNYGDGTTVSVSSGSLTGKAYSTTYYVYYNDSSLAGGAVTYVATTSPTTAAPNRTNGRHAVGKITTPAAAGAPTSGGTVPPGGYVNPNDFTNVD